MVHYMVLVEALSRHAEARGDLLFAHDLLKKAPFVRFVVEVDDVIEFIVPVLGKRVYKLALLTDYDDGLYLRGDFHVYYVRPIDLWYEELLSLLKSTEPSDFSPEKLKNSSFTDGTWVTFYKEGETLGPMIHCGETTPVPLWKKRESLFVLSIKRGRDLALEYLEKF